MVYKQPKSSYNQIKTLETDQSVVLVICSQLFHAVCMYTSKCTLSCIPGTRYSYTCMWFMYPHPHIQGVKMLHIYNVASYVC